MPITKDKQTIEEEMLSRFEDPEDLTDEQSAEILEKVLEEKIKQIPTFTDPILQHKYEQLLKNEDDLLSLDNVIAMGKVRLEVVFRKGKPTEVAQVMRTVVEAVEKAIYIRERHREYIHLEQVLWLMDKLFEIVNDEISDQTEVNRVAERLKRIRLISRDEVPLEQKRMARALSEGRRRNDVDV